MPQAARQDPREALNVPSLLLLVLAALGVLSNLATLVSPADLSQLESLPMDPQVRELVARLGQFAAGAGKVLAALGLGLGAVMAYGAWQMRQLRQYPLALAAAIVALLPMASCCCCLSLPVGVWALTILTRPEVRDAFAA
jgi:hypothetical protein